MARLWLTYAWDDNAEGDVDYVVNLLVGAGLDVDLDRYRISAGSRLWTQIASAINDPATDAWAIFATAASLTSEACIEELAYALDRALRSRGSTFPLIGIFPGDVRDEDIPPAIGTRLFVRTDDQDWVERVVAGAEGRAPTIAAATVTPHFVRAHRLPAGQFAIEFRPRLEEWSPVFAAVLVSDGIEIVRFVRGWSADLTRWDSVYTMSRSGRQILEGKEWEYRQVDSPPATPSRPYFLFTSAVPSAILFGSPPRLWKFSPTAAT